MTVSTIKKMFAWCYVERTEGKAFITRW